MPITNNMSPEQVEACLDYLNSVSIEDALDSAHYAMAEWLSLEEAAKMFPKEPCHEIGRIETIRFITPKNPKQWIDPAQGQAVYWATFIPYATKRKLV